ncbi:MAG: winged helix-turn-helix domain-containing tetratricopeptide repeat protein [Stellaceae bacterium]
MTGGALHLGRFRLDLDRHELSRGESPVRLGSRALDILCVLASARGAVVTKDELMARVWSGVVVGENNIHVHISALRRALDEDKSGQSCIVTVSGRGYRLIGLEALALVVDAGVPGLGLSLPDKPSIAVLPFKNMSSDPGQEFLADGIAEDIITALARFPSLFVIARNSSFTYKGRAIDVEQVGREFGVRYVLEESLRKSGNRIRVTAQLIEAETGKHVWAERYDRDLADIFAMQDEITGAVTIAVAPAIDEAERQRAMRKPPQNLDAWTAYQRGLWHLDKFSAEENRLAERFFQQAIDLDPNFADGYCGLALAQIYAVTMFQTRDLADILNSAEPSARLAVMLDGSNAAARSCLSRALLLRGDHRGALAEAERTVALSPNLASAYWRRGLVLIHSGRAEEGLGDLQTSIRFEPHGPNLAGRLHHVAIGCYFSCAYADAIEAAQHVIRSSPDFPLSYRWVAAALGQLGRTEEAKEALQRAIAAAPASFDLYVRKRPAWFRPEDHAHLLDGLRKAGWRG